MNKVSDRIEAKIRSSYSDSLLKLENESHLHAGPASESHFKLTLVSDQFKDVRLLKRHQMIYGLLAEEMQQGVHAMSLHLYSVEEWLKAGGSPPSPQCKGGSQSAV